MKINNSTLGFTKNDLLDLKIRRDIYQFILKNPGLHLREICRRLNISRGTVNYHLRYLEKQGLISIKRCRRNWFYYIKNKYGRDEENLLYNVRFDAPRNIIFYLIIVGSASQIELSKELNKHQTTIEFHLKKLMDLDIIEFVTNVDSSIDLYDNKYTIINREKIGREKFFRLKNQGKIYDLLITFYKNKYYQSDIADKFFYFVEELYRENPNYVVERLKTFKQVTDEFEDIFFDIFPNPYYC